MIVNRNVKLVTPAPSQLLLVPEEQVEQVKKVDQVEQVLVIDASKASLAQSKASGTSKHGKASLAQSKASSKLRSYHKS